MGSLEPTKNHKALLRALAWIETQAPEFLELHLLGWGNNAEVVAMLQRAQACGLPINWRQHVSDQPKMIIRLQRELKARSLWRWSDVVVEWMLHKQSLMTASNQN